MLILHFLMAQKNTLVPSLLALAFLVLTSALACSHMTQLLLYIEISALESSLLVPVDLLPFDLYPPQSTEDGRSS